MDLIQSDGEKNPFTPSQQALLAHKTITFALGSHFDVRHMWDDRDSVSDFIFMRVSQQVTKTEMEKMSKKYGALYRKWGSS